jgi:hypothetical protein
MDKKKFRICQIKLRKGSPQFLFAPVSHVPKFNTGKKENNRKAKFEQKSSFSQDASA